MRFVGTQSKGPHHGAITLERREALRFPFLSRPRRRDEDVALVNQLWGAGLRLCFLDAPLMIYRQGLVENSTEAELKLINPFWRLEELRKRTVHAKKRFKRIQRRLMRCLVNVSRPALRQVRK